MWACVRTPEAATVNSPLSYHTWPRDFKYSNYLKLSNDPMA